MPMYRIFKDTEGYYIDHESYGKIPVPEEMLDFVISYMSTMKGFDEFINNYNKTVVE